MEKKDFVLRGKYVQSAFPKDNIVECVYTDGYTVVVKKIDGVSYSVYDVQNYKPYVEKKRGVLFVNVYYCQGMNGSLPWAGVYTNRSDADNCVNRIARIEVPWVEGQGLEEEQI